MKAKIHILIPLLTLTFWGCPEDTTDPPEGGEEAGEEVGGQIPTDMFPMFGGTEDMDIPDMEPMEPEIEFGRDGDVPY